VLTGRGPARRKGAQETTTASPPRAGFFNRLAFYPTVRAASFSSLCRLRVTTLAPGPAPILRPSSAACPGSSSFYSSEATARGSFTRRKLLWMFATGSAPKCHQKSAKTLASRSLASSRPVTETQYKSAPKRAA
jgi:hypothetical protein